MKFLDTSSAPPPPPPFAMKKNIFDKSESWDILLLIYLLLHWFLFIAQVFLDQSLSILKEVILRVLLL